MDKEETKSQTPGKKENKDSPIISDENLSKFHNDLTKDQERQVSTPGETDSNSMSVHLRDSTTDIDQNVKKFAEMERKLLEMKSEHEAQEFMHASLIEELQQRCDRIIELEIELQALKSTQAKTTPENAEAAPSSSHTKARVIELEIIRKEQEAKLTQQSETINKLTVQVEQLQNVIQHIGAKPSLEEGGQGETVDASNLDSQDSSMDVISGELGIKPMDLYLLKTKPWDEKVDSAVKILEEVFEWQSWNRIDQWTSKPTLLPETLIRLWECCSSEGDDQEMSCVFTDNALTKCFALDEVRLPGPSGTGAPNYWEWVGGWSVDKEAKGADTEGWLYGDTELRFAEESPVQSNGSRQHHVRRRKWVRPRILVSIPNAAPPTTKFLQLHQKLAAMEVLCTKLSNQVLQMQTSFTEKEAEVTSVTTLQKQLQGVYRRWQTSLKTIANLKREISDLKNENRVLRSLASGDTTSTNEEEQTFFRKLFSKIEKSVETDISEAGQEEASTDVEEQKFFKRLLSKFEKSDEPKHTEGPMTGILNEEIEGSSPGQPHSSKEAEKILDSLEGKHISNEDGLTDAQGKPHKPATEEDRDEEAGWFTGIVSSWKEKVGTLLSEEEVLSSDLTGNASFHAEQNSLMF